MSNGARRFKKVRLCTTNKKPTKTDVPDTPAVRMEIEVENLEGNLIWKGSALFFNESLVRTFMIPRMKLNQEVRLRKRCGGMFHQDCGIFTVSQVLKEGLKKNEYMLQKKK
ncbi:MAG: hypothetical protein WAX66_03535 [Patescibacteria group bacterium]